MEKFNIYLGLNDKDTKTQQISTVEAYKIVNNMIICDFGGGTIFEADGIYKHDNGVIVTEKTLKIELMFTTIEKIKTFANELKKIFNQESVVIEKQLINSELF